MYYLEDESSYQDPDGDMMIIHESMYYYEPPVNGAIWYLQLDKDLTDLYRGKEWVEVKKRDI